MVVDVVSFNFGLCMVYHVFDIIGHYCYFIALLFGKFLAGRSKFLSMVRY